MTIRQLVLGIILVGLAGLAQAATIVVTTHLDVVDNDGLCSLREAMLNAENANQSGSTDCAAGSIGGNQILFAAPLIGSTIELAGQALPTITRSLEIVGPIRGNPGALTISAEATSRIFVADGADGLLISDLTLIWGRTFSDADPGSTIYLADSSPVRLERLVVESGIAEGAGNNGGAIAMFDSTVTIEESVFNANTADGGGGVIFSSNSTLEVLETSMGLNSTVGRGGAIHAVGGNVTISASQINSNITTGSSAWGGALFMDGADLQLLNVVLAGNTTTGANGHGGALYLRNAGLTMVGGRVQGNSVQGSGGNGGGISTIGANVNLSGGCEILDNSTQQDSGRGGGMRIANGDLIMHNCLVSGNQTMGDSAEGGGIYINNGNATIIQSQIVNNQTQADSAHGGGVRVRNGQLDMTDTLVQGNATHGDEARGGGIYHRDGDSQLMSVTIVGNSTLGASARGGGLYLSDSQVTMVNGTISGNQLGSATGPGLFATRSKVDLFHVTVADNINAPGRLSHLYVTGSDSNFGSLNLYNSLVVNNRCGSGDFGDVTGTGNIVTHSTCPGLLVPSANAIELGALTNNGGPTPTHAIGQGSLAINAAGNCLSTYGINTDQRGATRPGGSSSACDVGAYETDQPPAPVDLAVALTIDPPAVAVGQQVEIVIDVSNQSGTWASEVEAQIDLGSALIFQNADVGSGSFDPGTGQWKVGLLGPDEKQTLTLTIELGAAGGQEVAALVSGLQPDPVADNNQVSGEVVELPAPATMVVNTLRGYSDDDGLCSLREAIINANNANQSGSLHCASGSLALNTITFHPDLIGGTIELLESLPTIVADLSIVGPAPGPDSLTIDAMGAFRVFHVSQTRQFQLQDLTVTRGRTTDGGTPGAGLFALTGSTVMLERVRFINNVAESSLGGAIAFNGVSLSIVDSEIADNQALSSSGGGISARTGAQVNIERTSFIGNQARWGGAISLIEGTELNMSNSTVSQNVSEFNGAGISITQSSARLTHSTVAFNQAGSPDVDPALGQGIYLFGVADEPATLELENSLVVQSDPLQVACRIANTNTSIVSVGSFSTHVSCTGTATAAAAIGLLPLADNGGFTSTHALALGSVAISASGDCSGDFGITDDQRGLPRPGGGSSACDAGAFESQGEPSVSSANISTDPIHFTVQLDGIDSQLLAIGNVGAAPLNWSIDSNELFGANSLMGFVDDWDIANWTFENDPPSVDGSFTTNPGPPLELFLTGGNVEVEGNADFWIVVPMDGEISFDWGYQSIDLGEFDTGGYVVNGLYTQLASNATQQPNFNGSATVPVSAGDTFAFRVYTLDGLLGPGVLGVTNFDFAANFCAATPTPPDWLSVVPGSGTTPGESSVDVAVNVDAAGLLAGIYEAVLCIVTDDPANPLVQVPVTMDIVSHAQGQLAVSPPMLDFGQSQMGEADAMSFTVSNTAAPGAESFIVETINLSGDAVFAITGGNCVVGITELAPGQECTVEVTFAPLSAGTFDASVLVGTDDGQSETVSLVGEGVTMPDRIFHNRFEVGAGSILRDCTDCPDLVVIPAGSFTQGSPESEPESLGNERPQRLVNIPMFAMGRYPVTFAQWDACVADGGCSNSASDNGWGRGDRPVINVTWNDAQEYVAWLSSKTGQQYRLPSESEWEYAARAESIGRYNIGNCITTDQANFRGTTPAQDCPEGIDRQQTLPVGSFTANAFGLFDTHGNVWEWTQDCSNADYEGAPTDGSAWLDGNCGQAMLRGGSWFNAGRDLRSARRFNLGHNQDTNNTTGFRVARDFSG